MRVIRTYILLLIGCLVWGPVALAATPASVQGMSVHAMQESMEASFSDSSCDGDHCGGMTEPCDPDLCNMAHSCGSATAPLYLPSGLVLDVAGSSLRAAERALRYHYQRPVAIDHPPKTRLL